MTYKSPAIQNIQRGGMQQKSYKHVDFIELSHLKSVVDIKEEAGRWRVFVHLSWNEITVSRHYSMTIFLLNTVPNTKRKPRGYRKPQKKSDIQSKVC